MRSMPALVALACAIAGCGTTEPEGELIEVFGRVTYNGSPTDGWVQLTAPNYVPDGPEWTQTLDVNGTGDYVVRLRVDASDCGNGILTVAVHHEEGAFIPYSENDSWLVPDCGRFQRDFAFTGP